MVLLNQGDLLLAAFRSTRPHPPREPGAATSCRPPGSRPTRYLRPHAPGSLRRPCRPEHRSPGPAQGRWQRSHRAAGHTPSSSTVPRSAVRSCPKAVLARSPDSRGGTCTRTALLRWLDLSSYSWPAVAVPVAVPVEEVGVEETELGLRLGSPTPRTRRSTRSALRSLPTRRPAAAAQLIPTPSRRLFRLASASTRQRASSPGRRPRRWQRVRTR